MKSFIYFVAIATGISFFSSCSENEIENAPVSNARVEKSFGVSTPSSSTRAHINNFSREHSSQDIHWDETDKVTVFAEGHETGDTFSFKDFSDGDLHNHATFSGMTYESESYYVLYPAQSSSRLTSDNKIQFTIPSEQTATKGSFDPAAGVYIGHVENATGEIGLKNAAAYLSFHANPSVNTVQMEAKVAGWNLAGTVIAKPKSGGAIIESFVDGAGSSTVTLKDINGAGDYLLAFIPSNNLASFSVTVWCAEGVYQYDFSSNTQFLAGNIYELGTLGTTGTKID